QRCDREQSDREAAHTALLSAARESNACATGRRGREPESTTSSFLPAVTPQRCVAARARGVVTVVARALVIEGAVLAIGRERQAHPPAGGLLEPAVQAIGAVVLAGLALGRHRLARAVDIRTAVRALGLADA